MKYPRLICFLLILLPMVTVAQDQEEKQEPVSFEPIYDDPYNVKKLFVGFQPFYGELFTANINAGFGIDAHYFYEKKADFRVQFRKTYGSKLYDFNRELAKHNSNVDTEPQSFNYIEFGATWHIKDFDVTSKTKMVLYKPEYKGNKWAATVPMKTEVPCQVRKVYGARLGAVIWNGTLDLSRTLQSQGYDNASLVNGSSAGLPLTYVDGDGVTRNFNVFGNIYSAGFYFGGSMTWIRNVAMSFDQYDSGLDDGIFTVFLDIQYAPSLNIRDVEYQGDTYSTDVVNLRSLGIRAGMDGKFNRTLAWGYGGEIGLRPSAQHRTFYALFKISFPIYATNLDHKVESFGK